MATYTTEIRDDEGRGCHMNVTDRAIAESESLCEYLERRATGVVAAFLFSTGRAEPKEAELFRQQDNA